MFLVGLFFYYIRKGSDGNRFHSSNLFSGDIVQ